MVAVRTSETSVDNHFTRQYNPEDSSEQETNGVQGVNSGPNFLSPCYKMLILNVNLLLCSHFSLFAKAVSLKVVHPLKIYQTTKFHDPTLTGASFISTSKV
jgi:hypothetical protein